MVGRKVVLQFPMPCDRCGRTLHPGETVAQRIYPHRTYVTHFVCPGKSRKGGNKQAHEKHNKE